MRRYSIFILFILILFCGCKEHNVHKAIRLTEIGKYAEAISIYDKMLRKDSCDVYALINRGVNHSLSGDKQKAIEDYAIVINIDSANTLALVNRARVKYDIEDYAGSVEDYNRALNTARRISIHWYDDRLGTHNDAYEVDFIEIIFDRGWSYLKTDSLWKAYQDFSYCIDNHYMMERSYYGRGMANFGSGRRNEGLDDFKNVLLYGEADSRFVYHAQEILRDIKYSDK